MAAAVVVLFSTAQSSTRQDVKNYVVARRPLAIGTLIVASDLTTTKLDLPASRLRSRLFSRPSRLVGAVVVSPVAPGELIQASAVVAVATLPSQRQISVPVEASRSLGDRLQVGESVDVIATFGTGGDAFTVTVARSARVVARDANGGALGDRTGEVIVLAVPDDESAIAVAHAIAAGQISLVRVSGVLGPDNKGPAAPYKAPRPDASR